MRVRVSALIPALLLLAVACGGDAPDADAPPVEDTVLTPGGEPADPRGEPPDTTGVPADTTGRPEPDPEPPDTAPRPAPDPDPEPTPQPPRADPEAVTEGEWTVGIVEGGPEAGPRTEPTTPTVIAARTARHPDFDRFVLEFSELGGRPAFQVEYVDRPVRACGSGNVVELPGDGWLQIRMPGAQAHDDEGQVTVETREDSPGLPVLLAHHLTCDFEAHVVWVLAVASPNPFRVLELSGPTRLVVDVRH